MLSRLQISMFIGLALFFWVGLLWVRGVPLSWEYLWPYGLVVSILVLIAAIFERWGWAWRFLHGWFVKRPDIRGSWRVDLDSEWVDPSTEEEVVPITCYMVVRQTLTTLSMRMMTADSSSWLVAHKIVKENDGVFLVTGVYTNTPKLRHRGKSSEIHYGAFLLKVLGDPPKSLEGEYWTDRNSRGSMRLSNKNTVIFSTYEEAHDGFGEH